MYLPYCHADIAGVEPQMMSPAPVLASSRSYDEIADGSSKMGIASRPRVSSGGPPEGPRRHESQASDDTTKIAGALQEKATWKSKMGRKSVQARRTDGQCGQIPPTPWTASIAPPPRRCNGARRPQNGRQLCPARARRDSVLIQRYSVTVFRLAWERRPLGGRAAARRERSFAPRATARCRRLASLSDDLWRGLGRRLRQIGVDDGLVRSLLGESSVAWPNPFGRPSSSGTCAGGGSPLRTRCGCSCSAIP